MHFYAPTPHFNDTIDSLKNEFKDDTSDTIVVCGVHDTSKTKMVVDFKKRYSKVIAFNQEPLFAKQRQFRKAGRSRTKSRSVRLCETSI